MVGAASKLGSAAALAAALLVCASMPSAASCSLVSAGPAFGQTWAERREEIVARTGVGDKQPATTQLLYTPATPSPAGCAGVLAGSAEVRYRVALIAPTWQRYGALISAAAARHGVPAELILAAIVEESGGRAHAVAKYPGYVSDAATPSRVSIGLGQMLLASAQKLAPERHIDRAALFNPAIAIDLVARYFARFYRVTGFDPRLAGSSYNAGSVRAPAAGQRWSPPNPRYVARFVAVFDASVAHLVRQPNRPAVSFATLLMQ